MSIQKGDACPKFSLKNQFDQTVDIADFLGKKNMVIFFYPKDETPGCTKEACAFRDSYEVFQDLDCEVIGISSDPVDKHDKFAKRHNLPFQLLADTKRQVRSAFGVPNNLFGLIPGRVTYIIDKNGIIKGIFNSQTDPVGHIKNALETLNGLNN
jgi:peroxiredoxin Q/BCP